MKLPPVEVLLTWPAPNYVNPETRGNALLLVNAVFITLVGIVVGLRLYTRIFIKRWFGLDDIFILLALVFTVGLTAVVVLANQRYGWDRHIYDIPVDKLEPTLKIALSAKIVFTAAATFTRLSLHCFYYRLVKDTEKLWFKWCIHLNVLYSVGIFISFLFVSIFLCIPVSNYWMVGSPEGSCLDEGIATFVCGIINCFADFTTTITPLPLVMGLHMPRRQRIAVGTLFSLGIVVTVAGIVRTWFIYKSLVLEYDNTWFAFPLWIAAAVEIDLGVICASAPVLRPLISKMTFSLSETFSSGATIPKKGSSYGVLSKPSIHHTTDGSQTLANVSALSSKRRSEAIKLAPELNKDKGRSYELKDWQEESNISPETSRRSQDAILELESDSGSQKERGGIHKIFKKFGMKDSDSDRDDMTITRTSEVELQIEPANRRNSHRHSQPRDSPRPQDHTAGEPSMPPAAHWV